MVALFAATSAFAADAEPVKKQELKVEFSVPSSSEKAAITEARVVGKEIWVRVDITGAGGIGLAVISKAKATATIEAPALPIKYVVFGKKWGWKNKEKGIVFLADQDAKTKAKLEKDFNAGKVVYKAKK
jgi:hypothetical protein